MAGLIPLGDFAAATDITTAASIGLDGSRSQRAVDDRIQDVAIDIIASDPTVIQAATDAVDTALDGAGVVVAQGANDLVIRGEDETDTWMQARDEVDDVTGLALPTGAAIAGLHRAGVPVAEGSSDEDLIIRAENDVDSWMQASRYLDSEGMSGPTPAAMGAMGRAGSVQTRDGDPEAVPDLAPGEIYIYLYDGEPSYVIGS